MIRITEEGGRADGRARLCRREQCEVESVARPALVDPSEDGGRGLPRRLRRRLALLRIAERAPASCALPGRLGQDGRQGAVFAARQGGHRSAARQAYTSETRRLRRSVISALRLTGDTGIHKTE